MIGKDVRLERIINRQNRKTVIVPMDHGVTVGPILGIENLTSAVDKISTGGANAIILHKGNVKKGHRKSGKDIGLIIHLSASTSLSQDPHSKAIVCSVEEAIKLGADAVSIHINLGANNEKEMLKDFGLISSSCQEWGMPLLAMMYTRGEHIKNEFDVKVIKHAARVGAELGADIVKVNYSGSPESFNEVVKGCSVPVVIAGGEKTETDEDLLQMVKDAMDAGAGGISIGRNAFQHKSPEKMTRALKNIVHNDYSVKKAKEELNS
ncbi:MAG: 2-amino-3,7-dideoxy-D-threo-hept-6-ulosonate synthase [Candidatus Aureabacteria bacterium]|nr:2-amino-3,7-dideoxy-D-threo-hept-6-ulosonate synthase [Candidatus Auribacterota bacterium]